MFGKVESNRARAGGFDLAPLLGVRETRHRIDLVGLCKRDGDGKLDQLGNRSGAPGRDRSELGEQQRHGHGQFNADGRSAYREDRPSRRQCW